MLPRYPNVPEFWKTRGGAEKRLKDLQDRNYYFAKDAEVKEEMEDGSYR